MCRKSSILVEEAKREGFCRCWRLPATSQQQGVFPDVQKISLVKSRYSEQVDVNGNILWLEFC